MMRSLDKFRGCLLGGAAGDALGYEVEFMDVNSIRDRFGSTGIAEYVLHNGVAQISDDTQMTLFTATGLLVGTTRGKMRGIMGKYSDYIGYSYREWLRTQKGKHPSEDEFLYSWLANIPELYARRAPGMTCLSALESKSRGSIEDPINSSKGCGGVMRVAPIGLYFADRRVPIDEIDEIGAEVAALTHGHELGYIPAAALVHLIYLVSSNDSISLSDAVEDMIVAMEKQFASAKHIRSFTKLMREAVALSSSDLTDLEAIRKLGEGWVAEETLAIAIYCALKYANDFDKALIAAVNHNGDSDSTGAVTGNILGAHLGMNGIPEKYLSHLELKDLIQEIADDLYYDCQMSEYGRYRDPIWIQKYIEGSYAGRLSV